MIKKKLFLRVSFFLLGTALLSILFSCASQSRDSNSETAHTIIPFAPYRALDEGIPFIVEDYEGKAEGAPLPAWLDAYFEGGVNAIETFEIYNGRYCFVAEYSGRSIDMLKRRAARINVDRDFPLIAFFRIYYRFINGLRTSPDIVYGPMFERLMKRSMEIHWIGSRMETDCWVFAHWTEPQSLERRPQEDDTDDDAALSDTYKLFILFTVEKENFQRQFTTLVDGIQFDKEYNRTQADSFGAVYDNFFTGF
jgi:hypothetical protein